MFCPNCATQNSAETKYCRSCGANLTLVPQALTGQLPPRERSSRRHRRGREDGPATLEHGITKVFMGVGFVMAAAGAFFFAPAGHIWWFWMLIPAFAMLGRGVAEIVASWKSPPAVPPISQTAMPYVDRPGQLSPPSDGIFAPPSVTENTTRQLDQRIDPARYRERQ